MSEHEKKTPPSSRTILIWSIAAGAGVLLLGGMAAFASAGYGRLYDGRIFPGVRALGVRLDGLTGEEARDVLNKAVDAALKDGLRFHYVPTDGGGARDVTLNATTLPTADLDATRDLIRYDIEPAVIAALNAGRGHNLLLDTLTRWRARIRPVMVTTDIAMDEAAIRGALNDAANGAISKPQNATLDIRWDDATKKADVRVVPGADGRTLDLDSAMNVLRKQAAELRFSPITVRDRQTGPAIGAEDVEPLTTEVDGLLAHAPFRLANRDQTQNVSTSTLAGWLGALERDGRVTLDILPDRFATSVRAFFPGIEKTAKQGSLVIQDGVLVSFVAGTEGVLIDDAATLTGIRDAWNAKSASSTFPIILRRQEPALAGQDPERMGIKEIIGVGRSDFSGSPSNRRKNIANGVKKLDGTIVMPGEEFSLLKALGPIVASEGWLPELVIKGNKTVPELGGGLCQIGTTTFRGALASGLPITVRQSHSYRVRYYEPAGTDATIYEPNPDFRFKNDMTTPVLIHVYTTDGDELIYEFWGTRDGRGTQFIGQQTVSVVDDLKPSIFNVTSPPPTRLIETLDLKPGQKKCTEVAHAGADTEFTYTVTYANGIKNEQVFRSHYRPWQAVCLVGVEKLSEPPADATGGATTAPDANAGENGAVN